MKIIYSALISLIFLSACSKNEDSPAASSFDLHLLVGKEWWQTDSLGNPNTDFMRFQFLTDTTGNWIHLIYWGGTSNVKKYDTTEFSYRLIPPDTLRLESTGSFQLISIQPAEWKAYLLPRSEYPGLITFKPIL